MNIGPIHWATEQSLKEYRKYHRALFEINSNLILVGIPSIINLNTISYSCINSVFLSKQTHVLISNTDHENSKIAANHCLLLNQCHLYRHCCQEHHIVAITVDDDVVAYVVVIVMIINNIAVLNITVIKRLSAYTERAF